MTDRPSYKLPHEAYTSHVYPRRSSNGSTVIIYGHEEGVRLVWYGGKPFKPPKKDSIPPKVNGTAKSDQMVIDLDEDDDEPAAKDVPTVPAEFEEQTQEVDPSAPYQGVLRYVDIPLGTAALRIGVPHIAKDVSQAPPGSWPSLYLERIVVAVACADFTIQVISAALDPPAPEIQEISKLDIQTLKISGAQSHQDFISDVAITHTTDPLADQEDGQAPSRTGNLSQSHSKKSIEPDAPRWSLLIASISSTGAGLLLVHQLPIQPTNEISTSPEHLLPIRRQHLPCPSMGAKLAFNTSPYPAERHSSLLITFPAASYVKLFQVFPTYARERRGSAATSDSASTTRTRRLSGTSRGKFLITFLPPFANDVGAVVPKRKSVLDARWVAGGRAVMALLEDGEWGIWDLEAVGPTASSAGANLIRGQGNISGIQGGPLTRFAVRSTISSSGETKQKSSSALNQPASGSLAPMTPSTRKSRSEGLFNGSKRDASSPQPQSRHGSIYVEDTPSNRPFDECVVISYAGENVFIPSVFSFWKSDSKPTRLPAIRLGGQQERSFSLLPKSGDEGSASQGLFGIATSTPDVLVQTDHRLILDVSPLSQSSNRTDTGTQTTMSLAPEASDQALLASGELDIDGMDRILDDMVGDAGVSKPKPMNLFTKSVGFRLDEDEDVDMASPTPARYSAQKLPNASRAGMTAGAPATQRQFT